jgi:hypothetical protein
MCIRLLVVIDQNIADDEYGQNRILTSHVIPSGASKYFALLYTAVLKFPRKAVIIPSDQDQDHKIDTTTARVSTGTVRARFQESKIGSNKGDGTHHE